MLIPRDYQTEAVNSIWEFFRTHPVVTDNPVVAMPTGTGKAGVIAFFLDGVYRKYPKQKVLVATHVKELVDQNYEEFLGIWPTAPAGIYSAGLKRKDTADRIIFCGIASIAKNIEAFGHVDLIIIDECHLLSQDDESMYLKVIAALRKRNPYLRIVGLTATPWRAGQGKITDDGIFTHICFDVTGMESFNRFVREGYLATLIAPQTEVELDTSGVHMRGGDFNQKELNLATGRDTITFAACQEAVQRGVGREHWLVFASGIDNTIKITQMLNYLGISARCVHSKMPAGERDANIREWKEGKFTAMVNNGILTTGVNFKAIDLIVMLRPTASTVLWVQMLGRGTRPLYVGNFDLSTREGRLAAIAASPKLNCLVLDFAGNLKRLGPINDPVLPRKKGEKTGEVPIRICETCGMYNHISARFCGGISKHDPDFKAGEGYCGDAFSFQVLLKQTASTEAVVRESEAPDVKYLKVDSVTFKTHKKVGKPDSLLATYWHGINAIKEYVLIEHEGFGRRKAATWWRERCREPLPATVAEAILMLDKLDTPTDIKVWMNAKPFPEILDISFTGAFAQPIVGDEIPF